MNTWLQAAFARARLCMFSLLVQLFRARAVCFFSSFAPAYRTSGQFFEMGTGLAAACSCLFLVPAFCISRLKPSQPRGLLIPPSQSIPRFLLAPLSIERIETLAQTQKSQNDSLRTGARPPEAQRTFGWHLVLLPAISILFRLCGSSAASGYAAQAPPPPLHLPALTRARTTRTLLFPAFAPAFVCICATCAPKRLSTSGMRPGGI